MSSSVTGIPVPSHRRMTNAHSSPFESNSLSQLSQIDELHQKIRTLEHTNAKQQTQIEREKARLEGVIKDLKAKWRAEQQEWKEGCDTLQGCHHLAQLRLVDEISRERNNVLNEQEVHRREKLARLQRDFRIATFQERERELEALVAALESRIDRASIDADTRNEHLLAQNADYVSQVADLTKEAEDIKEEMDGTRTELSDLRHEKARLQKERDSTQREFERTSLRLEGANTTIAELQKAKAELQTTSTDLKRQLQRWENLEKAGGEEAADLRKERIELQVQIKSLEEQLKDNKERLERRNTKLSQLNSINQQWQASYHAQEDELKAATELNSDLELKLTKAEKLVRRLRENNQRSEPPPSQQEVNSEEEVVEVAASIAGPSKIADQARPKRRRKSPAHELSDNEHDSSGLAKSSIKPLGRVGPPRKQSRKQPSPSPPPPEPEPVPEEPSDHEEEPEAPEPVISAAKQGKGKQKKRLSRSRTPPEVPKEKLKGKGKSAEKPASKPIVIPDDEDEEDAEGSDVAAEQRLVDSEEELDDTSKKIAPKAKGARKQPAKPKPKPPSSSQGARPNKRKNGNDSDQPQSKPSGSRAATAAVVDVDDDMEEPQPQKKKMRKLNNFPSSQPMAPKNIFGTQPNDLLGGLIPTDVSPIKATDIAPARAASAMGAVAGIRRTVASTFKQGSRR